MTTGSSMKAVKQTRSKARWLLPLCAAVVLGAMALDTKVVRVGSQEDLRQQAFNPDRFGAETFPRVRDYVVGKAPAAPALYEALVADKDAAIAEFGTKAGIGAVMPVTFTGVLGEAKAGVFNVSIDGLPENVRVRLQSGPAINGTDLRDVTGDIAFGAFKNQIEYQDAGSGINRAMSAEVLVGLDRDALTGKTVTVTGAFTLINPRNWLVTPVAFEVAQ